MKKLMTILMAGLILVAGSAAQAVFTGWISPTANYSPNIIGDLGFNIPDNAYADGGTYAGGYAEAWPYGNANKHQYYGYNFLVPSGFTIDGIQVRLDAWRNTYATTGSTAVELSWDGGTTWTATGYGTGNLNYGETTYYEGGVSDTWGHTWTTDQINNSFRVRLIDSASGGTNGRIYLDWVPVGVTYTLVSAPEPATICLLGLGSFSLFRRKTQ